MIGWVAPIRTPDRMGEAIEESLIIVGYQAVCQARLSRRDELKSPTAG